MSEAAKFEKPRLDDALFDLLGDGLLSNHPEARERFHAEVDGLDGRPTAADARSLT